MTSTEATTSNITAHLNWTLEFHVLPTLPLKHHAQNKTYCDNVGKQTYTG
jgi:hypothetical protein